MPLTNLHKTPFPWFGGKADAAETVWQYLGDPAHYVEPFAGSLAVLLRRPALANRVYHSETVNDADGLLVNAWRGIQHHPDETAEAASWPVTEADMLARQLAILRWQKENDLERLMGDPTWCDPVMAGYWLYGISAKIGGGWCSGDGPWIVGADGRITRRSKDRSPGVSRARPHVGDNGQGVHRPQSREPGVSRELPHVSDDGMGVHHAGTREPGVEIAHEYHPMTMPELRRWMQFLSARLRHVRIINGDWSRVAKASVAMNLAVRMGGDQDYAGVFLDPPYSSAARDGKLYAVDDLDIAHHVREWCLKETNNRKMRIVLAGYADEGHEPLEQAGWRAIPWFKDGFIKGGYGNIGGSDMHQQHRERLWVSPSCPVIGGYQQSDLFK